VEYNASDTRNKNSVLQIEFNSQTLDMMGRNHKRVVIMDEVDGMSAGDRGGISAIIQTIKSSKTPIICICNDRQHDKIKTLAGHCYDIKFFKPNKIMVVKRLMDIMAMEGISAE
jgi:replication factor C subunit 1